MFGSKENSGAGITDGVIWKSLIVFAVPLLMSNLFQQLYTSVDTMMVGRYAGSESMAAVGSTGSLVNLVVGMFLGITTGAGVVVSQYYGAKDADNVSKAVHTGIVFSIVSGIIVGIIGITFANQFLRLMNCPYDVIDLSTEYLRVYFSGTIFSLLYNIGSRILIASGDSRRPLYYLIISSVANVVCDYIFLAVFSWGVFGAAFATIISQALSAALVIGNLMRSSTMCRIYISKLRISWSMLLRIIKIGIPTGTQSILYSVSNTIIQSRVNKFGSIVMAGATAGGMIDGFIYMPIAAMGLTITTFTGQNLGAGKLDRVKKGYKICLLITLGFTACLSAVVLLLRKQLLSMFADEAEVIEYGTKILLIIASTYFIYVWTEIYSGVMRGAGSAVIPMIICMIGICGVRILWIFAVVPFLNSVESIYLSYPLSWLITNIALCIYYYKGKWMNYAISKG